MSESRRLDSILGRAKGKEKKYEWLTAAELYGWASSTAGKEDFLKKGEIQERIGYCFQRGAFQAESQERFRERVRRAVEAYEEAHRSYEKLTDKSKTARMFRCDAVVKYLGFWLTSDPAEKRKLLDECLELKRRALAVFSESGDMLQYGRTYNKLSLVFYFRVELEWDIHTVKSIVEKGIEWGKKAVTALSQLGDLYEIARADLTLATCLIFRERYVAEPEEIDRNRLEVIKYLGKTIELSKKIGDAYLLGLSHLWFAEKTEDEESARHSEKALECGKLARDNFLIAGGLNFLSYLTRWKAIATEDPDERKKIEEEAMQFYDKGQHHYSIMSLVIPRCPPLSPGSANHYMLLAEWEPNLKKRLEFLEKAEKYGTEALKAAEDSDVPSIIVAALGVFGKTLEMQARLESDPAEKRRRLEKALKHQERATGIFEELAPLGDKYINLGIVLHRLAQIKVGLADVEPDLNGKRKLLEEAALSKSRGLKLIDNVMPYYERLGAITFFSRLHGLQSTYATLLVRLHDLTNKPEHLRKAIEILQMAAESASKAYMPSLIAESNWKIAKAQDCLGEHLEAAKNYERASESYRKATEKIPQLKDFYKDHALYMQAWSEIEQARNYHAKGQYGKAKENYEKAADLHKPTERWNYLHPNYLAWARLEEAEDLSRKEQTEEARDLFQHAANLFVEAKTSVKAKLATVEANDEKEMAAKLAKASDARREYCLGRIALEEAKILDRQGDHTVSSEEYRAAAEIFQKMAKVESVQGRRELQPLIHLCRAWQKMTLAEAKTSPTMYGEAAELFRQAKETALDQPASLLALAHSSFCKALEAGTQFEITRDMTVYSTAKRHMEAAESHYLKAGFKNASDYARATYMVFDAYMYTHKAETETDPAKKAQYYQMAEKLLQTSAGSYTKAKHPEKSEEVKRLLEGIKEKRQLAVSLSEVLHSPAITSTTASFSTPAPTHEQAVGLERFEHADIQANLILRVKEARIGEDVNLEIELINAGKAPALLIKVEKAIPDGFEFKAVPEAYRVEDSFIDLKGKRLNPLKTEEVKMVIQPLSKGTFTMKPRIRYLDENGKYRSHEPEPVTITVKELGIGGWIRGER